MNENGELFAGLVALFVIKAVVCGLLSRRHLKEWHKVGKLDKINVFPLKSAKGIELQEAECDYDGLKVKTDTGVTVKDRTFIVVTPGMKMVTARQKPALVQLVCKVSGSFFYLNAPNMAELVLPLNEGEGKPQNETIVWGDKIQGVDCGGEASDWVNHYLDTRGYRILYHSENSSTRKLSSRDEKWCELARDNDEVAYQDGFPFMLVTHSSVDDVNRKLRMGGMEDRTYHPVDFRCFRANFTIQTDCAPFDEDGWAEIKIGECHFYNIKPCTRCVLITVDPTSGKKREDNEPLQSLRRYRLLYPEFDQSPCFGINLILLKEGRIRQGDPVFIKRSSSFGSSEK